MISRHICPKCHGNRFITVAHVAQDWVVDEYGNYEECLETTETVADPDDDNSWTCYYCGAEAIVADETDPPRKSRETLHISTAQSCNKETISVDSGWLRNICEQLADERRMSFWEYYSCIPYDDINRIALLAFSNVQYSQIQGESIDIEQTVTMLRVMQQRVQEVKAKALASCGTNPSLAASLSPDIRVKLLLDEYGVFDFSEKKCFQVSFNGEICGTKLDFAAANLTVEMLCKASERAIQVVAKSGKERF